MTIGLDLLLELAASADNQMREIDALKWRGDCPSCGGEDRLVFGAEDLNGRPWLKCWGRCSRSDILSALGTTWDQVCPPEEDPEDLTTRTADLSRARPPRFAWARRIVIGRFNAYLGNEGIGKGALIAYTMARWTHGELDGDLKGIEVHVGIVGDEDDFDQTWTPRLYAAGARLEHVHQIERPGGGPIVIGADRERMAAKVRELGIQVLYFDQLLDNLGAGVDDWRQKQVRDAIAPLRGLARELDIAAIGTLHPNKRGRTFRELMSGTPAFKASDAGDLHGGEARHAARC